MTFIDKKTQLGDFFDDDEVVFYNNIHDLSKKLNYYKHNSILRKKIAKKGKNYQNMRIKHSVHVKYDQKLWVLIKNDKTES